jgi:NADH-quinone oxidoreductase subunit L
MVTAGIYMLTCCMRCWPRVHQNVVAVIGAATALFAATIAVAQNDIKKVLAYSTISQLGFMVAAVGLGAYVAGMFHLVTHAFFKALLFLSAGSVILGVEAGYHHAAHGEHGAHAAEPFDPQDMRNMGGLWQRMPVTRWVYVIGAIALAGLPPLAAWPGDAATGAGYLPHPQRGASHRLYDPPGVAGLLRAATQRGGGRAREPLRSPRRSSRWPR